MHGVSEDEHYFTEKSHHLKGTTCTCMYIHVHVHVYSGKLSREKTFVNFAVLCVSAKVFSVIV